VSSFLHAFRTLSVSAFTYLLCRCVPKTGKTCKACAKTKKSCQRSDSTFAAHPAVRRAFRQWEAYVAESKRHGDRHIITPGTYGTIEGRPTAGTYPVFSDEFCRLRSNFETLMAAAQAQQVPAKILTTVARPRSEGPSPSGGSGGFEIPQTLVTQPTPGRRNNASYAYFEQLAAATASGFQYMSRELQHDREATNARFSAIEQTTSRIAVRIPCLLRTGFPLTFV